MVEELGGPQVSLRCGGSESDPGHSSRPNRMRHRPWLPGLCRLPSGARAALPRPWFVLGVLPTRFTLPMPERSAPLPLLTGPGPQDCTGCGACCQRNGSPPVLLNSAYGHGEWHPFRKAGMPPALIAEVDEWFLGLRRGQEPGGVCVWYDAASRRCRHYQWRPQVCRDFEVGSTSCRHDRAACGLSEDAAAREQDRGE